MLPCGCSTLGQHVARWVMAEALGWGPSAPPLTQEQCWWEPRE